MRICGLNGKFHVKSTEIVDGFCIFKARIVKSIKGVQGCTHHKARKTVANVIVDGDAFKQAVLFNLVADGG